MTDTTTAPVALSFKNDPTIKTALVKRMNTHIEMDELVQGATGSGGKGCTVWCALNNGDLHEGYSHTAFESILGLPEWLARLQDSIFEGCNKEDAKAFSTAWVKAIPVGRDLTPVKWKFCAFILQQNIERVLLLDIADDLKKQVVDAINGVLKLHTDAVESGEWNESAAESAAWSAWSATRSAESAAWSAESAARSATRSAESAARSATRSAESAAESATRSAAWSAESAARSAARSAESAAWSAESAARSAAWSAESAAESAAWSAAFKQYADKLIELLQNA